MNGAGTAMDGDVALPEPPDPALAPAPVAATRGKGNVSVVECFGTAEVLS